MHKHDDDKHILVSETDAVREAEAKVAAEVEAARDAVLAEAEAEVEAAVEAQSRVLAPEAYPRAGPRANLRTVAKIELKTVAEVEVNLAQVTRRRPVLNIVTKAKIDKVWNPTSEAQKLSPTRITTQKKDPVAMSLQAFILMAIASKTKTPKWPKFPMPAHNRCALATHTFHAAFLCNLMN